jgi:tRNA (mo5U34)-methyltransferase
MVSRTVNFLGIRTSLFASGRRAGVEVSLPIGALRRGGVEVPQLPLPKAPPANGTELARAVADIEWYHTIDLGQGVVTPGYYDHTPILEHYRLPERLDGMRVLDVACFDGFWSFEFERRGAAEVVAIDLETASELDLPWRVRRDMDAEGLARRFGGGFEIASRALGSKVRRVHCNVYDLNPDQLGTFDLVHCGDLLLHLRDPMGALMRIRAMTHGSALISDVIYPDLDRHDGLPIVQFNGGDGENIWWRLGANALSAMIYKAGFDAVVEESRFRYGARGQPHALWHAVYRATP